MVTFAEFVAAFRVFQNDREYSGGSNMTVFAPWNEPQPWQDGLSQLLDNCSEVDLLQRLQTVDTILVSCTDKDMVRSAWEMESMGGTRTIFMIAVAGGVVQPDGPRYEAMRTIATWLFEQALTEKMPSLGRLSLMIHNEVCGAVRQWNNGETLVDLVRRVVGKPALVRDFEENTLMTALSRHGAKVWQPFNTLPQVMVSLGLFDMQRDGVGKLSRVRPLTTDGFILSVSDLQDSEKIKKILG